MLFYIMLGSALPILWSIIFLFSGLFGVNIFTVRDQRLQQFSPKVKHASVWNNEEPDHWILGFPYIGYINTVSGERGGPKKTLYLLTSNKFYSEEILGKGVCKGKYLTFYMRGGNFFNITWSSRRVPVTQRQSRDKQQQVIVSMIKDYKTCDYTVVILHGETGSGKSMIPLLLGKHLLESSCDVKEVSFVDTFNPTEPGDTFERLYAKINPTEKKPLIVVLEEWDCGMTKVHEERVPQHKHIPTQIKNKSDWNTFMDRFDQRLFPYVFFIMTSNRPDTYFDSLDISYTRAGRVSMRVNV
jgi:Cdc6-like AAA superfamily ATPase